MLAMLLHPGESPSSLYCNLIGQNILQPLRYALRSMKASNLIPVGYDGQLSYSIQTYLGKLKKQVRIVLHNHPVMEMLFQAKIDSDRYISSVVKHKAAGNDKPKTM